MASAQRSRGFTALRVEGGILPPEFLQTVATLEAPNQSGADYGLSKSLAIKEELARNWRIANDLHGRYAEPRPRQDLFSRRVGVDQWLVPFLSTLLGYDDLTAVDGVEGEDRTFNLTHRACGGAVPILLVTHDVDLDKADRRFGYDGGRQTPFGMMQEYLNAEDAALWGMVSNGSKLRILRDNASLTRPAYIEADLDLLFLDELYPDFAALWLSAHASRFRPTNDKPSSCIIESWRKKAHETGERVREKLRDGVTESLSQVGNGFLRHPQNDKLRAAFQSGDLSPEMYFQQLLRLVYRFLFLFTVEERNLLHPPDATDEQRAVFAEGYSLSKLRERALRRRHYDEHQDLWQGLQITFQSLAAQKGAPAIGLPALGGLMRKDECPHLDKAVIANRYLLEAIRTLAFFRSDRGLTRINYRDMDTEELGSVYESLLELRPSIDVSTSPWTFAFHSNGERSNGSERKLTGSYYTPPTLVNQLIRSTLDPVIDHAIKSRPDDPRSAVLALKIVDPACGSGHFLLAAARRLAAEIARIESESNDDIMDEVARQHALRDVVRHCIYGVDRNPLAVELCKTALWIETVEPGKPLGFLDARILQGDSLIGVINPEMIANGIPSDAYKALTGDDKDVCRRLKKSNAQPKQGELFDKIAQLEVAVTGLDLDAMPEKTLADVDRKREIWEQSIRRPPRPRESLRANIFVGTYFTTKTLATEKIVPKTQDIEFLDSGLPERLGVENHVRTLASKHSFMHWHLAFAEIMEDGGFDVVIGNPPWERIKLQEREFFALRSPEIASAPKKAERERLIQRLSHADALPAEKALFQEFEIAKREAEAASQFTRTGGRFPLTGVGDVNTYALFAETFLQLLRPSGRSGLIVPTGIATDASTKSFFSHIVSHHKLVSLFDFQNRDKFFPSVGSLIRFSLLTISGKSNPDSAAEFAFFLHRVEHLKESERRFPMTADDFSLFNPNTQTCPSFRTRCDMEIARKMHLRAGVLWKEAHSSSPEDNPWGVSFQRMFDMANDSDLFKSRAELEDGGWRLEGDVFVKEDERYVPLYEAKLFHQYDHRFATFDGISKEDIQKGNARPMLVEEKSDFESVSIPRYWVPEADVARKLEIAPPPPITGLTVSAKAGKSLCDLSPERRTNDRRSARYSPTQHWVTKQLSCDWGVSSDVDVDYRYCESESVSHTSSCSGAQWSGTSHPEWLLSIRKTTRATDERTSIVSVTKRAGMSDRAPLIRVCQAEDAALLIANLNSIVLDFVTRTAVGGTDLSYFIIKQLPVLRPSVFQKQFKFGRTFADLIIPRVLKLIYNTKSLQSFAHDLGYYGPPFPWNEQHRHCLRCELDAIFAYMYGLSRSELEWILDASPPNSTFSSLKKKELRKFDEYRTKRYILSAFDSLNGGNNPDLIGNNR